MNSKTNINPIFIPDIVDNAEAYAHGYLQGAIQTVKITLDIYGTDMPEKLEEAINNLVAIRDALPDAIKDHWKRKNNTI